MNAAASFPSARVLTIVLNYRTAEMTLRAVAAARKAMQGIDGAIIVVDNDSQDGSFEQMSAHVTAEGWADVTVLAAGRNGGFGAGNNFGILAGLSDPETAPDFIYVLNSDAFPEPDAIQSLLDHMLAHPQTGFAGSLIYGEDGVEHTTTFRFPSLAGELEGAIRFGPVSRLFRNHQVPMPPPKHSQPVDWVAGASLMMRVPMLRDIGLFDEAYFLYFEETDLCLRGQRAGYSIDFVRESRVMHIGSVSTGMGDWARTPRYWFQSRWYYHVKNHGRLHALCASVLHLIGGGFHRLRCVLRGRRSVDSPMFLRDLIRHDAAALFRPLSAPQIPQLPDVPQGATPPVPEPARRYR